MTVKHDQVGAASTAGAMVQVVARREETRGVQIKGDLQPWGKLS